MESKRLEITEVDAGKDVVLQCPSNDFLHNFEFWQVNNTKVIGPGTNDFDNSKYKYEVLSGKLHIKAVRPEEAGFYRCFSKNFEGTDRIIGEVEVIVKHSSVLPEVDTVWDALKLVAIVVSILVIIGCIVLFIRLRKDWKKYDGRTPVQGDDADEEEPETDEVYNRTTTTKLPHVPTPVPGPSRNASSDQLFGIDNQGLDTDFNSVFENIQIKSATRPLITM